MANYFIELGGFNLKLHRKQLVELVNMIKNKKIKPAEIILYFHKRIVKLNPIIKAFLAFTREEDLQNSVDDIDGKLPGIPIGIKDNINTSIFPTSCAAKIESNIEEKYNAFAVEKILAEGGVIAGKTNLDEFGMVPPNYQDSLITTLNPWNLAHIPGGSSSGSAAAVAAGLIPASLGTDTGGSVRIPAAHCGLVGFKPTYGLISRCGVVAFAPTLDQIGPITKSVADAAYLMDIIAGYDVQDPLMSKTPEISFTDKKKLDDFLGVKFGLPADSLNNKVANSTRAKIKELANKITDLGGEIVDINLPDVEITKITYYIIAQSEVYQELTDKIPKNKGLCSKKDGLSNRINLSNSNMLSKETKRRILIGGFVQQNKFLYSQALKVRTKIINEFNDVFKKCDFVLTPTTPYPAEEIANKKKVVSEYTKPDFTTMANITGRPAITLPVGLSEDNLPIGAQLLGDYYADAKLMQVAENLEELLSFSEIRKEQLALF